MVTEFGMSEKLGPLAFGKRDELVFLGREIGEQRNYCDDVAKTIDEEVRAIIDGCYSTAVDVLTTYKDRLIQLAERLVAEETIEQEEFETMFADLPDPRKDTHMTPMPLDGSRPRRAPDEPATGTCVSAQASSPTRLGRAARRALGEPRATPRSIRLATLPSPRWRNFVRRFR